MDPSAEAQQLAVDGDSEEIVKLIKARKCIAAVDFFLLLSVGSLLRRLLIPGSSPWLPWGAPVVFLFLALVPGCVFYASEQGWYPWNEKKRKPETGDDCC